MNIEIILAAVFGEPVYLSTFVIAKKDGPRRTEYVVLRGRDLALPGQALVTPETCIARGESPAAALYAALQVAEREGRIGAPEHAPPDNRVSEK